MVYCLLFYSYIDQRMGGLLHCDVSLHSVWYSLCHSLLYIIIFHHNDIIQSNDGKLICGIAGENRPSGGRNEK